MLYRAVIASSTAAASGDVHLAVKVQQKVKTTWKMVPGGAITVVLDRASVLDIIISDFPPALRQAALNELIIQSIQAWQLDADIGANLSLNDAFLGLLKKDFPITIDLPQL